IKTRSNSSPRDRGKFRFDKLLCISPGREPRHRQGKSIRYLRRAKPSERQLQRMIATAFPNRRFARASMPRARVVRFLVARADVNLQMLVADAAHDVTSKFVSAEFAAGRMTIEESDFAAGPNQRRFFQRH